MSRELVMLLLAFNGGLLLTLALRAVWRRNCGASTTYRLWLLAPLTALSTLLPMGSAELESIRTVLQRATAVVAMPAELRMESGPNWMLLIWILGVVATLLYLGAARWRLGLRIVDSAVVEDRLLHGMRVVRADFGPALIGLWRPRLVLPHGFEQQFDDNQQTLVFAHEAAHLAAGDLWVRALALLTCVAQWWNPLAWMALYRLIDDQESACDERVMLAHPNMRHTYARTLIAGHEAVPHAAMILCSMHQSHPLVRRIAMLNRSPVTPRGRKLANALTAACLFVASALAWAAGGTPLAAASADFKIDLNIQIDEHAPHQFSLGGKRGEQMGARVDDGDGALDLDITVTNATVTDAAQSGQVLLSMVVRKGGKELGRPALAFPLGKSGSIRIGDQTPQGFSGVRIDATITAWSEQITMDPTASTARKLAQDIADKAGLQLEGAELLSETPMEAKFDDVRAESALQIIADLDNLNARRVGNSVRLETR